MPPETDSRMSMKSGVVGSSDQRTTDRALGSDGITGERTPGSQAYVAFFSLCIAQPRLQACLQV